MEISKPLQVGTYNIQVMVTGDIVKEEVYDAQDGTVDMTYILKATEVAVMSKEEDVIDKTSIEY